MCWTALSALPKKLMLLHLLSDGRVIYGLGSGRPEELGIRSLSAEEKRQQFRARTRRTRGVFAWHSGGRTTAPDPDGFRWRRNSICGLPSVIASRSLTHLERAPYHCGRSRNRHTPSADHRAVPPRRGYRGGSGCAVWCALPRPSKEAMADVREPAERLHAQFSKFEVHAGSSCARLYDGDLDGATPSNPTEPRVRRGNSGKR